MKITFLNTQFYLIPEDASKSTIPNGWELNIRLPPQMENLVTKFQIVTPDKTENTLLTLIATNGWLTFLFGVSMQPLFDMINSL